MSSNWKHLAVLALCLVAALSCGDDPKSTGPDSYDYPAGRLYVLNQGDNSIYIYDSRTLERTDSMSSVVEEPHFIEFSEDHQYYYVVSRRIGGLLAKFRTSDNTLLATIPTQSFPTALTIDKNNIGYLCDFTLAKGRIRRYDMSGESMVFIDSLLQAGVQTHDINTTPDGSLVIAAGYGSDDLVFYDVDSDDLVPLTLDSGRPVFNPASANYGPYGIQIDHTGTRAFIACSKGADQIRIVDLVNRTIVDSILIPVSNAINPDRNGPTYMDLSPDNKILYVSNFLDNSLSVVDVTTLEVVETINFQTDKPFGVYLTEDGSSLYVSCTNTRPAKGMVYVIDARTYEKLDSLEVGVEPFGIDWIEPL